MKNEIKGNIQWQQKIEGIALKFVLNELNSLL